MVEGTPLSGLTLAALVEAVAADQPSPGAGAAASVSLALAAACAAKAFVISARHQQDGADLTAAAGAAQAITARALDGAQQDAADFAAALKSRHGTAAEAALRADGEALLALVAALRDLIAANEGRFVTSLRGDLLAAIALSDAAERVHRHNLGELDPAGP